MITTRRLFLSRVCQGMLCASLGPALARELGLAPGLALDEDGVLDLGPLEALSRRVQESEPLELLSFVAAELRKGVPLERFVAAAALANARAFGGHDYEGYHCEMALLPALEMARRSPGPAAALPVLKVLHRSAARLRAVGGGDRLAAIALPAEGAGARELKEQALAGDVQAAERSLAGIARSGGPEAAHEALQELLLEDVEVHRIVLAWRAWDLRRVAGAEHAETLLRQVLRFCADQERGRIARGAPEPSLRRLLPALLEAHGLQQGATTRVATSDAELEALATRIRQASRDDAAALAAEALGAGIGVEACGEALSLAAIALLLHDRGMSRDGVPGKPRGSVHGASVGVHACDSANAWRHVAASVGPRLAAATLIAGAYHTADQDAQVAAEPYPWREAAAELELVDPAALLRRLDERIAERDQVGAGAAVQRYADAGHAPAPLVERLLASSLESDGALHAEKYFLTAVEEHGRARPAFRWRHLVGLARVCASQHGFEAPGLAAAREMLRA